MPPSQSVFDANAFMETTHKGNLDTTFVLPDPGEYPAQVVDVTVNSGIIGDGKQRAGEPWANVAIQWEILDENVKLKLNMDKVIVRQSLMLDLSADKQLDLGTNKNMRLKRLLDVTGLNKQKSWSFGALKFANATVKVDHRPDPEDPTIIYAEVVRVAKAA